MLKTNRIGMDVMTNAAGEILHVQKLIDLKQWAQLLAALGASRLSFHVLEHPDPGEAIVEYAGRTRSITLSWARANSAPRRHLGSVSSKVVSEAPCSVTIIRAPAGETTMRARQA